MTEAKQPTKYFLGRTPRWLIGKFPHLPDYWVKDGEQFETPRGKKGPEPVVNLVGIIGKLTITLERVPIRYLYLS